MASAQKSLKGLMSQLQSLENDFTCILMEAALKLATLADANIFLLVESSDGRRYAGPEHLCAAFQRGNLGAAADDKEMEADLSVSGLREKAAPDDDGSLGIGPNRCQEYTLPTLSSTSDPSQRKRSLVQSTTAPPTEVKRQKRCTGEARHRQQQMDAKQRIDQQQPLRHQQLQQGPAQPKQPQSLGNNGQSCFFGVPKQEITGEIDGLEDGRVDNDFDDIDDELGEDAAVLDSDDLSSRGDDDNEEDYENVNSLLNDDIKPETSNEAGHPSPDFELSGERGGTNPSEVEGAKEGRSKSSSPHLSDFSVAPLPTKALKRKKRRSLPTDDEYTLTTYPCPGCGQRLVARTFEGESMVQNRVEAFTPQGYVLIRRSKDLVLPCPMCLVVSEGMRPDQWREAVMHDHHLKTQMQTRIRQHFMRKHELCMRGEEGFAMKELGKRLLCSCLHQSESAHSLPEASEAATWILPADRPPISQLADKLRQVRLSPPPADWLHWISESGKCGSATVKCYSNYLSKFVGLAKIVFPQRRPTLMLTWNESFCREFLDVMNLTNSGSGVNLKSALSSARRFLTKFKRRPENYADILSRQRFQS